jgi:hypothetical protein
MSGLGQKFVKNLSQGSSTRSIRGGTRACFVGSRMLDFCVSVPILKDRSRIMNISNRIFLSVGVAVFIHLAACGDPKSPAPAIVVTFFSTPPTSINTGSTVGIMAAVANDPQNGGVNFTCSPIGSCGLFNPVKIASTIPTCYEAPETVPEGNTVTITATSVTDPTKSVSSAPITILVGSSTQPCAP